MKYKRLVTVLAMLIAASAFGQSIDRVVFQQQGAYLSEDIFEMNTQTKAGMPYSERIVNEDVRRLFALGMFADVVSEVKDLSNGKKEVIQFNAILKGTVLFYPDSWVCGTNT